MPVGSRLHGILQPPWFNAVSKIQKLKQTHDINLRFLQNKPSFRETNYTTMLLGLPCGKPRTLVTQATGCAHTCYLNIRTQCHAPLKVLHYQIGIWLHASPWRPLNPPIYIAQESGTHTMLHAPSCATWFFGFSSTCRWTSHAPAMSRKHLLISFDVITPHQQSRKHVHISLIHVSPSYVINHVARHVSSVALSAPRHLADYWPGPT